MSSQSNKECVKKPSIIFNSFQKLFLCLLVGVVVWLIPPPEGMDIRAWRTFAIFLYTLLGMILKPIPVGAITLSSLFFLVLTNILTFKDAFSGFSAPIVWLIVLAFFIARGFIKTGLGMRIAYRLMALLGKNTLGMAYGIVFTDWILSCAIPSVTARAGGVIYPVLTSLSQGFGSHPNENPKKMGSYLILTIFQCGAITSAMFLTAMAGNPMIQSIALANGFSLSWGMWALAAIVPGLISLLLIPIVLYKLFPPTIKRTPEAKTFALAKLNELGKMTYGEWVMVVAFVLMITLWILSPFIGVSATVTALGGLLLLVFSNVLTWDDILKEKGAWDTLIWFASLVVIASALNQFGFIQWFSDNVKGYVSGMSWQVGFLLIALIYYYSHYLFASNIAHIASMYAPFLVLSIAIGTPPALAVLTLGFFSSLFGSLTTYGSGPAPIFFSSGYVSTKDWWRFGFLISIMNITIWLGIGSVWWRILGLI